MFGANLGIPAQICDELLRRQVECPRILRQMAKMTLKIKVNDLHFQYQPRVSQDACFGQTQAEKQYPFRVKCKS